MPVTFPTNLIMFWKKRTVTINEYDPTFKVLYLGNMITSWAKGEGCTDKPLSTLWKTYCANSARLYMPMELTVCASGMKAVTKKHGLTEYWANRVTYCCAPADHPGVFCWVYRHEGPRLKQELRCHAALCLKPEQAHELTVQLNDRLALALQEFRREKLTRQKARLSLANACYDCPCMPRRKLLLYRGTINFKPPIEMSKIAPKLTVIEEDDLEDELAESAVIVHGEVLLDDSLDSSRETDSLGSNSSDDHFSRFKLPRNLNSIGEYSEEEELSDSGSEDSDRLSLS